MINTVSKINLSKIGWEGGRSTSIWIMSLNLLCFFLEITPQRKLTGVPKFLWLDPIIHFGAPKQPFWILQLVRCCRQWVSVPGATRLVFCIILWQTILSTTVSESFKISRFPPVFSTIIHPYNLLTLTSVTLTVKANLYFQSYFLWSLISPDILNPKQPLPPFLVPMGRSIQVPFTLLASFFERFNNQGGLLG